MFNIPVDSFQYILMPLISAQLLLMVLFYFMLVRRKVIISFPHAAVFLITFIVFLLGKGLQSYTDLTTAYLILYGRMSLLFSVGLPSLLLLNLAQQHIRIPVICQLAVYALGFMFSMIYVISMDGSVHQIFFDADYAQLLPFTFFGENHVDALVIGVTMLVLMPCLLLFNKEYNGERQQTRLAFIIGSLSFSLLLIVGLLFKSYWLYYIGSIITALCWCWAVYQDLKRLKGEAQLLKDELNYLLRSGEKNVQPELNKLLSSFEQHANGNLEHYKLKIREILNFLTDTTISVGGDSESLIARNIKKIEAVTQSDNLAEIRQIAVEEAESLTTLIADIPLKRSEKIVEITKQYIANHYQENIDAALLAKQVHVSESYLMRNFKSVTGNTIKQYLTAHRIEKAKALLVDHNITDTALTVGFSNSNYFSTVFKKSTGLTPQQYVKNI